MIRAKRRPRRAPHYLEALESRHLLSSALIPVTNHSDLIFDNLRNILYIPGTDGNVQRYDVASQSLLSAITVGGSPGFGDITPDGHYLLMTDRIAKTIHRVDLTNSTTQDIAFAGNGTESRASDLVVVSNSLAYFHCEGGSGARFPLHTFDIAAGAISSAPPPLALFAEGAFLFRSADYSTVLIEEVASDGRPQYLYNVAQNAILGTATNGAGWWGYWNVAVSGDGSRTASADRSANATTMRDGHLAAICTGPGGSSIFSTDSTRLYILKSGTPSLLAYDTTTLALKATFDVGEVFTYGDIIGAGQMAMATASETVFVTSTAGIRIVNIHEGTLPAPTLMVSSDTVVLGESVVVTAQLPGPPSDRQGTFVFRTASGILTTTPVFGDGSYAATFSTLPVGTHTITVEYQATNGYKSTASTPVSVTVTRATPTFTLTALEAALPTFRVSFSWIPTVPVTGSVYLYEGDTFLGWQNLSGSSVDIIISSSLSYGDHVVTARYNGDGRYLPVTSEPAVLHFQPHATTTTLATSDPRSNGQQVRLTAHVAAGAYVPAGSVTFMDGGDALATVALDSSGNAVFMATFANVGSHALSAVFGNTLYYAASTSEVETHAVTSVLPVIDLLVVYASDCNTSTITQTILSAVDWVNVALVNSLIPAVIRLVHIEAAAYSPSTDYYVNIERLQTPGDGYLEDVAALRSQYQADLVSLFVGARGIDPDDPYGGRLLGLGGELRTAAGDPNTGYTVISAGDAGAPGYILAHELGHNFGASHDLEHDATGNVVFPTGRGFRFRGNDYQTYRDIMAYEPGTAIPYFSNPNVWYQGAATGTASANAAAVIAQNATLVANYSNRIPPTSVPHAPVGEITSVTHATLSGWAADANAGIEGIRVRIDIDGVPGIPFIADDPVPALMDTIGSTNHGFTYSFPARMPAGEHIVSVYMQDAPGSGFVLLGTRTVDTRVDLAVSLRSLVQSGAPLLPGDLLKVPVTITNTSGHAAAASLAAPIRIDIRAAGSDAFDSDGVLLGQVLVTAPIGAGASVTRIVSIKLPANLRAGAFYVAACVDPLDEIDELDETNNAAVNATGLNCVYQFGNIAGRRTPAALTFADADGTLVTVLLSGPGIGSVAFNDGEATISLAGTTATSAITIRTVRSKTPGDDGVFRLAGFTNNSGSLRSITAGSTTLTADLTVAGSLGTLCVSAIQSTTNLAVTVAGRLNTLTVGNVVNAALQVASMGSATIRGEFRNSSLTLSDLYSPTARVLNTFSAAQMIGSAINAAGNIGTITTGLMDQTVIRVGIVQDGPALATDPADFASLTPQDLPVITSLTLRPTSATGPAFVCSQVSAGRIVTVTMPNRASAVVTDDTGMTPTGFAVRILPLRYVGPASRDAYISPATGLIS